MTLDPETVSLLKDPSYCTLVTLMPDGSPQATQVWVDTDGENILVNTEVKRQKVRNVKRDPRVALNIVDPANAWRVRSVRGTVVDVTRNGADDHIDALSKKYTGQDTYGFGQPGEVRVIIKIRPDSESGLG